MGKKDREQKKEIAGIFFIAAAAVFAVAYFFDSLGFAGRVLQNAGFGLFGITAYVIPVLLVYMAFDCFLESETKITRKRMAYVGMFVIGISSIVHLFFVPMDEFIKSLTGDGQETAMASEGIKRLWESGLQGFEYNDQRVVLTGGLIGGGISFALASVADKAGAAIILFAFLISDIILLFNVSFSRAITKTKNKLDEAVKQKTQRIKKRQTSEDFDVIVGEDPPKTKSGLFGLPSFLNDDKKEEREEEEEKDFEPENGILQFDDSDDGEDDGEDEESFSDPNIDLPAGIRRVDGNKKSPPKSGEDVKEEGKDTKSLKHEKETEKMPSRPYIFPSVELLNTEPFKGEKKDIRTIQSLGKKLEKTLESFGISAKVVNITNGPIITRFELSPGPGVKVSKIVSLADDIALNLAATGVRIEAPIPGKSAIGIEVPNRQISLVALRSLIEYPEFKKSSSVLTCVLGRDIPGNPVICDITKMPHLLIAGATGSGKSVCINSILMSILYKADPEDLKILMIDPKVVELSAYNGIPHLLSPVITNPKKAANSLNWAVNEMNKRYALFAEKSVRDVQGYNSLSKSEEFDKLPLILIIIDELSDLMATSPREVEDSIARLTSMARASGIHMIIATQRPSVDVITGIIKANIPSRIAFSVSSQVDSRTILDSAGAEKLLGKGDMLYYPVGASKAVRVQGSFVTEKEVERVTSFLKSQNVEGYDKKTKEAIDSTNSKSSSSDDNNNEQEEDELFNDAVSVVVKAGYASISILQRKMNIGYPRAARLIDRMNEKGYVGPFEGSKPRKVTITPQQWAEHQAKEGD